MSWKDFERRAARAERKREGGLRASFSRPLPPLINIPTPRGLALMTAWHEVSPSEELTTPYNDLYVCHPSINQAQWAAGKKPGSVSLLNTTASLIHDFASDWFIAMEAVTVEGDFFHTSVTQNPSTRLKHSNPLAGAIWYSRPSASLGTRLANFVIANIPAFFQGVYSDETRSGIPDEYWTAWKTAVDGPTEPQRSTFETLWDQMQTAWLSGLKTAFGTSKAVIVNCAGDIYPNAGIAVSVDGAAIEDSHIIANGGDLWALDRFQTFATNWSNSPNRYGNFPLNVAWDYDLQRAGLVMRGTSDV